MAKKNSTLLVAIAERFIPMTLAIVVVCAAFIFKVDLYNIGDYKFVYSNIISFSSIIIGFLITMVSILVTFTGKRVMRLIKSNRAENLLKSYFSFSIASGVVVALLSILLGIIFDYFAAAELNTLPNIFSMTRALSILWIFLFSYFMSATARVFYVMLRILKSVIEEESSVDIKRTEADASIISLASIKEK